MLVQKWFKAENYPPETPLIPAIFARWINFMGQAGKVSQSAKPAWSRLHQIL